jgi:hypothetical protein
MAFGQPIGTVTDIPILTPMNGMTLEQGGSTLLVKLVLG